jgi:hypothetical protein
MMIIGCDFHTRYQQIAMLDEGTGELTDRRLDHPGGEAEAFYRNLQGPVGVGIETTGPIRWFERLLAELGHELWIGDAAKIRASEVRKQKTGECDTRVILDLSPGATCSGSGGSDANIHFAFPNRSASLRQTGRQRVDDWVELWQSCNHLANPKSSEIVL